MRINSGTQIRNPTTDHNARLIMRTRYRTTTMRIQTPVGNGNEHLEAGARMPRLSNLSRILITSLDSSGEPDLFLKNLAPRLINQSKLSQSSHGISGLW